MNATAWLCAVLSIATIRAGERMNVSVCTQGRLSAPAVAGARSEAAILFHAMDIEIVWAKCEAAPIGEDAAHQHWFTIRLRGERPPGAPNSASLETLGEAFFSEDQPAYVAEVYYAAGQALAAHQQLESNVLLGCVMAHELGHLLLGPGHSPDGVMRAGWDPRDLEAIRKGWLRFSRSEGVRMRQALHDPGAVSDATL